MNCVLAQELISASIDDEATGAEMVGLEAHLSGCGACRGWRVQAEALQARLAALADEAVPEVSAALRTLAGIGCGCGCRKCSCGPAEHCCRGCGCGCGACGAAA